MILYHINLLFDKNLLIQQFQVKYRFIIYKLLTEQGNGLKIENKKQGKGINYNIRKRNKEKQCHVINKFSFVLLFTTLNRYYLNIAQNKDKEIRLKH